MQHVGTAEVTTIEVKFMFLSMPSRVFVHETFCKSF